MNTAKIAALYPLYLSILRTRQQGHRLTVPQLLLLELRAAVILADGQGTRYRVSLEDLSHQTVRLDERCRPHLTTVVVETFCPARVHAWAVGVLAEHPPMDAVTWWELAGTDCWRAHTRRSQPGSPPRMLFYQGKATDFAVVLRGLRSYQRKQYRQARKLVAQLWAYHLRQTSAAPAALELTELVVSVADSGQVAAAASSTALAPGAVPAGLVAGGLLSRLRRALAARIHQVAVAAEAVLVAEGRTIA